MTLCMQANLGLSGRPVQGAEGRAFGARPQDVDRANPGPTCGEYPGCVPRCGVNDLHRGLVSGLVVDYAVSSAGVATSF